MVLQQIHSELAAIYATPVCPDVQDFVITDATLAASLTPPDAAHGNQERLLVQDTPDGAFLSLYIDAAIVRALSVDDPTTYLHEGNFESFLIALEGMSHLNYALWRGERAESVTPFELELQAEIDKYVACAKLFAAQQDGAIPVALHHVLFNGWRLDDTLDAATQTRYTDANFFAAKYCADLRRRFPGLHHQPSFVQELRAFYRLSRNQKVSRIRAVGRVH
jgi:hypothetical protein